MSRGNTYENDALLLEFNNTGIANIGDATGLRGSTVAGSLFLSLHTADPGEAGTQTTSENAYTNYARVAVARSGAGFTVSGSSVVLASNQDFPTSTTGANEVAKYFGVGALTSGAGKLMYYGIIGGPYKLFTAATSGNITSPTHGYVANDQVVFEALEGISLPGGVTEGTFYFVIATGLTADVFQVSTTSGGAAITISSVGSGTVAKSVPINIVGANVTPRLGTGTTIVTG